MTPDGWLAAPEDCPLAPGEIHVWTASLDPGRDEILRYAASLSTGEEARAARFHFERDRNRFIAGRGILRSVLARYLDTEPAQVVFNYGPHGKPALIAPRTDRPLFFNLAHSEGLLLLAATRDCEAGVDVEKMRRFSDMEAVARRILSARQFSQFQELPEPERVPAFFRLWTRKEAWLKAVGAGMSGMLDQIEVTFVKGESPRIIRLPQTAERAGQWTLSDLSPAADFVGALAVPLRDFQLRQWQWPVPAR
jgi:4'-phosphopantetheinyl transferase